MLQSRGHYLHLLPSPPRLHLHHLLYLTISVFYLICLVLPIASYHHSYPVSMFVTKYSTRIPLLNRFGSASSRLFCASVDTPNTNQLRPQRTIDPSFYEIPIYTPSEKIQGLVERYMANIARFEANQYLGEDSKRAFARALHFVDQFYLNKEASSNSNGGKTKLERYVILDSGCGRGMSTIKLAKRFPDVPVIGVDRSRRRLLTNTHYTPTPGSNDPRDLPENRLKFLSKYKTGRNKEVGDGDEEEDDFEDDEEDSNSLTSLQHEPTPPNALLLHAELADFWRLVYDHSDWIVQKHFLLHPNPYPKLKNLKKRWHAHPSVVYLLGLGGDLVVRSSWPVYLQEFFIAITTVKSTLSPGPISEEVFLEKMASCPEKFFTDDPLTHFEQKYLQLGVPVYQYSSSLGIRDKEERKLFIHAAKLASAEENVGDLSGEESPTAEVSKLVEENVGDLSGEESPTAEVSKLVEVVKKFAPTTMQ